MLTHSEWRARFSLVLQQARLMRSTHTEVQDHLDYWIRQEVNRVTGVNDLRSAYTMFDRGYVTALTDMMFETMYREDFEFCYTIDGELLTTSKEDTGKRKVDMLYGTDDVMKINTAPGGHYWKGTDKPFFISFLATDKG